LADVDEESTDPADIEAYKKSEKEQDAWNLQMGAFMGQLPLQNGKPAEADLQWSADGGHCKRAGLLLTFNFLVFDRVDQGAPAMIHWLSQRGCEGFKYSLDSGLLGAGGDEGDDPAELFGE
jgi:hypothetical protein